jgi:DNA-binding XRE family transcriptional regulator
MGAISHERERIMRHVQGNDGTILVTRIGKGWLFVPAGAWSAFTAAVKRGDYDPPERPLRKETCHAQAHRHHLHRCRPGPARRRCRGTRRSPGVGKLDREPEHVPQRREPMDVPQRLALPLPPLPRRAEGKPRPAALACQTDHVTEPPVTVVIAALVRSGEAGRLRQSAGISQETMAAGLGITRGFFSRVENGRQRPGRFLAFRYLRVLRGLARHEAVTRELAGGAQRRAA